MSSNIRHRTIRNAIITLSLLLCLWIMSPFPADASILGDFFSFSFDTVAFSKNEVNGSESISLTIIGKATCKKNIPVSPTEGTITGSVIARNTVTGTEVTLNPSYTVVINPFPKNQGDITETEQVVTLQFPARTETGEYNIVGKLIVAKVKIAGLWLDVTEFLPREEFIGKLKYTAPEPSSSSSEPVSPTEETGVTPATESFVSELPFTQSTAEQPSGNTLPWWVLLLVPVVVLIIIIAAIIWYLRHRRSKKTVENNI